jgi:tRNA/rRNA methyltransferase/tRNA (cytidine32/uridine32-2'-O)-methyltransferase
MNPRALALWLKERKGTAGVVFGNERTGLEDAELDLCNVATHIPVSHKQPSLNLSHAVQIYAYEFFLAMEAQSAVKGEWQAMNQQEISQLVSSVTDTLANIGFYKITGRQMQSRFFTDIISRAGLTEREGRYFKDIIAKAARLGGAE